MMDANLKRIYASHVMIVLRMISYLCRKQLGKESELLITLPVGILFFNMEHHVPLILACFLPVVNHKKWSGTWGIKGSKFGSSSQDIL